MAGRILHQPYTDVDGDPDPVARQAGMALFVVALVTVAALLVCVGNSQVVALL